MIFNIKVVEFSLTILTNNFSPNAEKYINSKIKGLINQALLKKQH